ncbi:MAG: ester cyclase [Gemmobacter sp.]
MADDHAARSAATLAVIHAMEAALAAGSDDMAAHFHDDFIWRGNFGCGVKRGLAEFRRNWQLPLRAAFTDRVYRTERFLADGDWAACFGAIEATHAGPFMGIAPTGRRVRIPYMDFWRVADGRIADNPVFVDFAAVLHQLGRDVFAGEGWEGFDSGARVPPHPATQGA